MSQVKSILKALEKHGTSTYTDLEADAGIPRNKLRWSCNSMKNDGLIKQTEEPLTKEVAWQITPAGRTHLEKIGGSETKPEKPSTVAKRPATKAKKVGSSATPADGGENIIRRPESEYPVGESDTSPEVRPVVETQAADNAAAEVNGEPPVANTDPAVSDVKNTVSDLSVFIDADGHLTIENLRFCPSETRKIGQFLIDTEPVWN